MTTGGVPTGATNAVMQLRRVAGSLASETFGWQMLLESIVIREKGDR
jgi:hypothetical protein